MTQQTTAKLSSDETQREKDGMKACGYRYRLETGNTVLFVQYCHELLDPVQAWAISEGAKKVTIETL